MNYIFFFNYYKLQIYSPVFFPFLKKKRKKTTIYDKINAMRYFMEMKMQKNYMNENNIV